MLCILLSPWISENDVSGGLLHLTALASGWFAENVRKKSSFRCKRRRGRRRGLTWNQKACLGEPWAPEKCAPSLPFALLLEVPLLWLWLCSPCPLWLFLPCLPSLVESAIPCFCILIDFYFHYTNSKHLVVYSPLHLCLVSWTLGEALVVLTTAGGGLSFSYLCINWSFVIMIWRIVL